MRKQFINLNGLILISLILVNVANSNVQVTFQKVFDMMLEREDFPTQKALKVIKAEVSQLF